MITGHPRRGRPESPDDRAERAQASAMKGSPSLSRPPRKTHFWTTLHYLAWGALMLAVLGDFLLAPLAGVEISELLGEDFISTLSFGSFVALLLIMPRYFTERRKNEALAAPSGEAVLAKDERPPVVYLRSFRDEDKMLKNAWRSRVTQEELLANVMRRFGPFVAIGNPTEELPKAGAARMYVRAGDWQAEVRSLLEQAAFVVIRLGDSAGVVWELEQSFAILPRERIILLNALKRAAYQSARDRMNSLGVALPAVRRRPSLIYFEAERAIRVELRSHYLHGPNVGWLELALSAALAPFVRRLGLEPLRMRLNPWKVLHMTIILLFCLVAAPAWWVLITVQGGMEALLFSVLFGLIVAALICYGCVVARRCIVDLRSMPH